MNDSQKIGLCRLEQETKKLVNSHIIPEAFYRIMGDNSGVIKELSLDPEVPPRKAPIGTYDQIVCTTCESLFGEWDDYAFSFLTDKSNFENIISDSNGTAGYDVKGVDYRKMKLFCISLLWRAHVSSKPLFAQVDVGEKHEQRLRNLILDKDPGREGEYSVAIWKYDKRPASLGISSPIRVKGNGINRYQFYLGGFILMIKVDKQNSSEFEEMAIKDGKSFPVVSIKFSETPEFELARKSVLMWRGHLKNQNKWRD